MGIRHVRADEKCARPERSETYRVVCGGTEEARKLPDEAMRHGKCGCDEPRRASAFKCPHASAPFLLEVLTAGVVGGRKDPQTTTPGGKESPMCDFSLQSVRSRPAKVGDKLVTRDFGTGTRGFAATDDLGMAVCLLPGTELAFAGEVACLPAGLLGWKTKTINHQTAIFRQVNKEKLAAHHDALEFPDGRSVLLTLLCEGQAATVLQLPAQPKTEIEAREQERVGFIG